MRVVPWLQSPQRLDAEAALVINGSRNVPWGEASVWVFLGGVRCIRW